MREYDSTTNVRNYGLNIFNSYNKNKRKPFVEDMTEDYLEEDNITMYMNLLK